MICPVAGGLWSGTAVVRHQRHGVQESRAHVAIKMHTTLLVTVTLACQAFGAYVDVNLENVSYSMSYLKWLLLPLLTSEFIRNTRKNGSRYAVTQSSTVKWAVCTAKLTMTIDAMVGYTGIESSTGLHNKVQIRCSMSCLLL